MVTSRLNYEWSMANIKFAGVDSPFTECAFVSDKRICTLSSNGVYILFELKGQDIFEMKRCYFLED